MFRVGSGAGSSRAVVTGFIAAAASALCVTAASAADFGYGGDCCADLEERIAELEATTVRKGNRKVSLTISGLVNEQVMFWDDGRTSDVYQTNNTNISSRFRFLGEAQITPDWSAGYMIELEAIAASSLVNQLSDESIGAVRIRKAEWHLKSKTFGKLSVGQGSSSTDDIILATTSGCHPACFSDVGLNGGGFLLRQTDGTLAGTTSMIRVLQGSLDTDRVNRVRYDTPTFAGFTLSASWGEDDMWDAALWYAATLGEFKVVAQGGYFEDSEGDGLNPVASGVPAGIDFSEWKGSASILHQPTGLFVTGAYVHREWDTDLPDYDYWYVRGGISQKYFGLGKTVFYGEYGNGQDGVTGNAAVAADLGLNAVTGSEIDVWGLGLVQHIDAAAMQLYVGYKNFSVDVDGAAADPNLAFEDLDVVFAGAMISF